MDAEPGLPRYKEVASKFAPSVEMLCANVLYKKSNELALKPYKVFDKCGVRVGVGALMGIHAWCVTSKKEGLDLVGIEEGAKWLAK